LRSASAWAEAAHRPLKSTFLFVHFVRAPYACAAADANKQEALCAEKVENALEGPVHKMQRNVKSDAVNTKLGCMRLLLLLHQTGAYL
jgi:hypothetical protein